MQAIGGYKEYQRVRMLKLDIETLRQTNKAMQNKSRTSGWSMEYKYMLARIGMHDYYCERRDG